MSARKVSVLGSGVVGEVLANGFLKHGYAVMRGTREPQKLADWRKTAGERASVGDFAEAARYADFVVLAVKGTAAEAVVGALGKVLGGKTVVDATNPIADEAPVNGVLNFFTESNSSLMERLQRRVPDARFVKAFSCVGSPFMVNPTFAGGKPSMFICGNDAAAKKAVGEVLAQFGWETEDMGAVEAARAIEPLCRLWCIPGFARNEWSHAFKLLKA